MPALPPVAAVIRLVLNYKISTDLSSSNRIYLKYQGAPPDNTAMTTFAGQVATSWTANMAPMCHSSVSLTSTVVTDLTTTSGGQGVNTGVHAGTRTGSALPAGTCALVNYTVQRRYRGGKPRTYLPVGVHTDVLDGQHWTTAFQGNVGNAWSNFIIGFASTPPAGTSGLQQCSVSYYEKFHVHYGSTGRAHNISDQRISGPIVDIIIATFVDPEYGSQRRRNRP